MDDSYNPSDEQLRTWYEQTSYWLFSPELLFRIGHKNRCLDELMIQAGSGTYTFITAWNPQSRKTSPLENEQRQQELLMEVGLLGYTFYPGAGEPDDEKWSPEPSLLILGISRTEALDLGKRYNQKAIVFGTLVGTPELLFIQY